MDNGNGAQKPPPFDVSAFVAPLLADPPQAFADDVVSSAAQLAADSVEFQSVWRQLKKAGVPSEWKAKVERARPKPPEPDDDPQPLSLIPSGFKFTDYGNAERLVARYRQRLRFCPPRRAWLAWDGKRWRWDETGVIERLAKRTVREIYTEVDKSDDSYPAYIRHAFKSEEGARIRSMIALAATEEGIPVLPLELDSDPWLLNCNNGTLDLRTGKLLPHRREDLITKLSPVDYDPRATHPMWFRYLVEVTGGDTELAAYLRRMAGYALVGLTPEKRFFFLHGPPDSAKSTFIDALSSALGDYAVNAAFNTWCVQSTTGGNRGDLVRLAGARLVTSVEVRKGARFDEEIMKKITGGDEITAAAKYQDDITFRAAFTLLLAANDAPAIRDDDSGMWSRVTRIPFEHIPPKKDPAVKAILRDPSQAGPAILAWAVAGCLEWQRSGLGKAAAIDASNADYRQSMDRVAGFFDECLVFEDWDEIRVSRTELRSAYDAWCRENGVKYPLTAKDLSARLREKGAFDALAHGVRIWRRVRLRSPDDPGQNSTTTTFSDDGPDEDARQYDPNDDGR